MGSVRSCAIVCSDTTLRSQTLILVQASLRIPQKEPHRSLPVGCCFDIVGFGSTWTSGRQSAEPLQAKLVTSAGEGKDMVRGFQTASILVLPQQGRLVESVHHPSTCICRMSSIQNAIPSNNHVLNKGRFSVKANSTMPSRCAWPADFKLGTFSHLTVPFETSRPLVGRFLNRCWPFTGPRTAACASPVFETNFPRWWNARILLSGR